MKRHPLFLKLYGKYLNLHRRFGDEKYTDADPFKCLYVDPSEIRYVVNGKKEKWGRVSNCNWDEAPLEERTRYKSLRRHFNDGVSWEDLPLDTNRGHKKDQVFEKISSNGYRSQRELHPIWNPFRKRDYEIGVVIDADGGIKWIGYGQHRLIIAKLLDLEEVPVQVHIRHQEWQNVRDELRTASSVADLSDQVRRQLNHPDLADLRSTFNHDEIVDSEEL